MENMEINFIGYNHHDFITKIEMGVEEEHDAPLSSIHNDESQEFPFNNASQNLFSMNHRPNEFQNIFSASFNSNPYFDNFEKPRKHPPFKIIRKENEVKKEEMTSSEENSVSVPLLDKIADKSRRIMKREKAKQRNLAKAAVLTPSVSLSGMSGVPEKYIPEGFDQPDLDDKSKKKMIQMIRNRLSAQSSRDKKKAYLRKLEQHQKKMATENMQYQNEIKQLKQANEALKGECEYLRRCLMSAGEHKPYQSEAALKEGIVDINHKQDIEMGPEFRSRPFTRRNYASGQLLKYSLALATVFAVLMFSNVNLPNEPLALDSSFLQLGQQSTPFESNLHQKFFTSRRRLDENSPVLPDMPNESALKTDMEQETYNPGDNLKTTPYQAFDELRKFTNIFHEDYMTKFMSQLKVNTSEDLEVTSNITFPQYLKKSLEEKRNLDSAEAEKTENSTKQNYSALFCPSGFAIDTFGEEKTPKDAFTIKLEDEINGDAKKEMKLNKSDWLQLIVPKSNLLPTYVLDQENVKISSDQGCKVEDRSLIELWCKIVNVKTLQSGL